MKSKPSEIVIQTPGTDSHQPVIVQTAADIRYQLSVETSTITVSHQGDDLYIHAHHDQTIILKSFYKPVVGHDSPPILMLKNEYGGFQFFSQDGKDPCNCFDHYTPPVVAEETCVPETPPPPPVPECVPEPVIPDCVPEPKPPLKGTYDHAIPIVEEPPLPPVQLPHSHTVPEPPPLPVPPPVVLYPPNTPPAPPGPPLFHEPPPPPQPPTLTANGDNTFIEGGSLANGALLGTQGPPVSVFNNAQSNTIESGQLITDLRFTVSGLQPQDGDNEKIVVDGTTIALGVGSVPPSFTADNHISYFMNSDGHTATITLTKLPGLSQSEVNTLVDNITYQNTNVDNPTAGDRIFAFTLLQDSGPIGFNSTTTGLPTSTVHVVPVNDAPENNLGTVTLPTIPPTIIPIPIPEPTDPSVSTLAPITPLSTNEDQPLAFTGTNLLSVTDPDARAGTITVMLYVNDGTLSLTTSGSSIIQTGGNGYGSANAVVLNGTLQDINNTLSSLSYTPITDFNGSDVLNINTNDNGNTGAGGARSDIDNIPIAVQHVNQPPELSSLSPNNLVLMQSVGQSVTHKIDERIQITDPHDTNPNNHYAPDQLIESASVVITGTTNLKHSSTPTSISSVTLALDNTATPDITGTYDSSTGTLTLTSTTPLSINEYQTALQNVTFSEPLPRGQGSIYDTFSVSFFVSNPGSVNPESLPYTRDVTVTSDHNYPTETAPPAPESVEIIADIGNNNSLNGSDQNDIIAGNGGPDALFGEKGNDVLSVGDSSFAIVDGGDSFRTTDPIAPHQGGFDTLSLDPSTAVTPPTSPTPINLNLDNVSLDSNTHHTPPSGAPQILSIEDINLGGISGNEANNKLTVSLNDLLDMSNQELPTNLDVKDSHGIPVVLSSNYLVVDGDGSSIVKGTGGFTASFQDVTLNNKHYNIYTDASHTLDPTHASADLLVQTTINNLDIH